MFLSLNPSYLISIWIKRNICHFRKTWRFWNFRIPSWKWLGMQIQATWSNDNSELCFWENWFLRVFLILLKNKLLRFWKKNMFKGSKDAPGCFRKSRSGTTNVEKIFCVFFKNSINLYLNISMYETKPAKYLGCFTKSFIMLSYPLSLNYP